MDGRLSSANDAVLCGLQSSIDPCSSRVCINSGSAGRSVSSRVSASSRRSARGRVGAARSVGAGGRIDAARSVGARIDATRSVGAGRRVDVGGWVVIEGRIRAVDVEVGRLKGIRHCEENFAMESFRSNEESRWVRDRESSQAKEDEREREKNVCLG